MKKCSILPVSFDSGGMPSGAPFKTHVALFRGISYVFLLAIFATELAAMEILWSFTQHPGDFPAVLADSAVLTLCAGVLCWKVFLRPLSRTAMPQCVKPVRLLCKVLVSVFLVEFFTHLVVLRLLPSLSLQIVSMIDAAVATVVLATLLYGLLFRSLSHSQRELVIENFKTPLKLYVLLIFTVFLIGLLKTIAQPVFFPFPTWFSQHVLDAFMTAFFAMPVLWLLVIRPLTRTADIEKSRSDAICSQARDAIISVHPDKTIEAFNPAAENIFGYAAADIVGLPFSALFEDAHHSDGLLDSVIDGEPATGCIRIHDVTGRRKDGSSVDLAVSASRILLSGEWQYVVILRDVSDRKKIEHALLESSTRFREIIEQSEDAIIFLKPGTSTIIDVNATAEDLYGFSRSELAGSGLALISRRKDLAWLNDVISSISTTKALQLENVITLRKDRTEINASVHGKVITIMGVEITYCTIRDISDRVRMNAEARDIQARLIQANKMTSLGLLVSGVAHEINNPNTYVLANAQLLSRTWDDCMKVLTEYYRENGDFQLGGLSFSALSETSPQLFAGIIDGAKRIDGIVRNLKDFARTDRGKDSFVDINSVATSAVTMLHHELIKHTENFRLDLAHAVPPVKGSHQQLEQVIINLLMNACQALSAKTDFILLSTGFDADSGFVTITVRDEGRGMTREVSRRIMDPFFTTKIDSGGTGLGLSISNSIIKEHNGTLEFESEPGSGTVFIVKLPPVTQA